MLATSDTTPNSVPYETFLKVQQALHKANQKIHQLENRITELETERKQHRALWRSSFKPAEKLVITELQRQIDHPVVQDAEGFSRFCYETAAINIGMSSSTPKRKIEAILEQCPDFPLELKHVEERDDEGRTIPRLYVKAKDHLLQAAATLTIQQPRKQGGNQYLCQQCGSSDVKILRRLHCNCCGHETNLEPSFPNGKLKNNTGKTGRSNLLSEDAITDDSSDKSNTSKTPKSTLLSEDAPTDQSTNESDTGETGKSTLLFASPPTESFDEPLQLDEVQKPDTPPRAEHVDSLLLETEAARLLQAIAGTSSIHIGMNRRGASKYRTIAGKLTLEEALEHLRGKETYGAFCSHSDGRTRALCWDTDSLEEWERFKGYARALVATGYLVILEESRAGRGGHLWIIFDGLVDTSAARSAVSAIVADLAEVKEYWPAPEYGKGNRVRLPGGKYLRPGLEEWCQLMSVADGEISSNGTEAAQLLLTHQTPATLIPLPDSDHAPGDQRFRQTEQSPASESTQVKAGAVEQEPGGVSGLDDQWERKYNTPEGKRLWFAWTDDYLITRFNEHHLLDEIRPRQYNGKSYSPNVEERTPSTAYWNTPNGERYTDFSTGARKEDGSPDTGDAFELSVKLSGRSKSQVLKDLGQSLVKGARAALESAARNGHPLPGWLEEIITQAGREHYQRLCYGNQPPPQVEQRLRRQDSRLVESDPPQGKDEERSQGGVLGFSHAGGETPASHDEATDDQRQLHIGEAVLSSLEMEMQQLEAMRSYGEGRGWASLVIDGVELIPEGRLAWLRFVWLSHEREKQRQVFEYVSQV